MSRRDWLLSVMGWDGGLPLLVATSPVVLTAVLPRCGLAEFISIVFLPIGAALFRAHHGLGQLERRDIEATLCRQFLLGCAVIVLLLFEVVLAAIHCAPGAPPSAWLAAGVVYGAYLCFIVPALRPPCLDDPEEGESTVFDDLPVE